MINFINTHHTLGLWRFSALGKRPSLWNATISFLCTKDIQNTIPFLESNLVAFDPKWLKNWCSNPETHDRWRSSFICSRSLNTSMSCKMISVTEHWKEQGAHWLLSLLTSTQQPTAREAIATSSEFLVFLTWSLVSSDDRLQAWQKSELVN